MKTQFNKCGQKSSQTNSHPRDTQFHDQSESHILVIGNHTVLLFNVSMSNSVSGTVGLIPGGSCSVNIGNICHDAV